MGTVTEIYDYLRLLFARVGVPHCPRCGREIQEQSVDQIVDSLLVLPEGTKVVLLAPVVGAKKGEHQKILEDAKRMGYVRVRVDGEILPLDEEITLDRKRKHTIEIVVDRLVVSAESRRRFAESVEGRPGDLRRHAHRPGAGEGGGAGGPLLPEERLPHLRHQHPRAAAAAVLLQQPLRRLRRVLGPRA